MIEVKYRDRAVEMAKKQGALANSPLEVKENGEVTLCAAACLAYAGVELTDGKPSAEQFISSLSASNDKREVIEVFERFGWGRAFCNSIMVHNDNTIRSQRIQAFKDKIG